MTIKQQGGIFGRNPTFNNVTVDGTLTVDQIVEKTGAAGITLDGVTLKDGNVVLADGKGINFSATAGTGTSELFDDYEEGVFTPSVSSGSGAITTVGAVNGFYTKVGRLVTATFGLTITNNGTGSGFIVVTGLPFAPNASTTYSGSGIQNSTAKSLSVVTISAGSQTYIRLFDGTYPVSNGETLRCTVTYIN